MPNWAELLNELKATPNPFDQLRRKYLRKLSTLTGRNTIAYYSGWQDKPLPPSIGNVVYPINDADLNGFMTTIHRMDRRRGLDLLLHTPGGDIAGTEALVNYLNGMFDRNIRAIVPHMAMSSGTMIALSCSEIMLGKHSFLGPIDPQLQGIPAKGILKEFEDAKLDIADDPRRIDAWKPILAKYPPTLIGRCRLAVEWAEMLAADWLCNNMFQSDPHREKLAARVVNALSEQEYTKSHNRHYGIDLLRNLGLKLIELEKDPKLQDAVLSVHHGFKLTLAQTSAAKIIQNQGGIAHILTVSGVK